MNAFKILDPVKLKNVRGERSQDEIVAAALKISPKNSFTKPALSNYEKGNYKPDDFKIPVLIEALGTTWDAISSTPAEIAARRDSVTSA